MNKDYINKIICNEHKTCYVVKSFNGDTLRIEQLKKKPINYDDVIDINQIRNGNKKVSIVYYGYGIYDKKVDAE